MKVKYVSIFAIVSVLLSSMPVLSGGSFANYANAKYSNSQAQSFVNECGLDESSGINCVASGPGVHHLALTFDITFSLIHEIKPATMAAFL